MSQEKPIKLSRVERLILHNQYLILNELKPKYSLYAHLAELVGSGYETDYQQIFAEVPEGGMLPAKQCLEIKDILDMHWVLDHSYRQLTDKLSIPSEAIAFTGFSLDKEETLTYYADCQTRHPIAPYAVLMGNPAAQLQSPVPMMPTYKRMLKKWAEYGRRRELTGEEIWGILRAKKIKVVRKPDVSRRQKTDSK